MPKKKNRGYTKQCWRCGSVDTFITSPLPYDEENIIYVACCNACASWSFVRQPKAVQRVKRMLYELEYNRTRRPRANKEVDNEAPEFTMDFTQGLDNEV